MSDEVVHKTKPSRPPEQQAARDARRASRIARPASSHAESSTQSQRSSPEKQNDKPTTKRRREAEGLEELEVDLTAPEPLSKAEIRAARKKAKKGGPDEDTTTNGVKPEEGKAHGGGEAGDLKREGKKRNSIWIGNLSFKTTPELLKDFVQRGITELGGEGEESVTRVNLPKKPGHGEFAAGNKGFAYVDMATPELQARAVELSERMLEGRRLLIKLGNDHTDTPNARTPRPEKVNPEVAGIIKKQTHQESMTLFAGNLPFDATEEALRDLVESNAVFGVGEVKPVPKEGDDQEVQTTDGERKRQDGGRGGKESGLRKVRLGAFEDTGRCKGFAFLDFYSPAEATLALTNRKNHVYDGRKLTLQYASAEATKRSGGRNASKKVIAGAKKVSAVGRAGPKRKAADVTNISIAQDLFRADEPPHLTAGVPAETQRTQAVERKGDQRGKKWEAAGRPRPGAALAMAKREKVGIVEGQGEKIVFD